MEQQTPFFLKYLPLKISLQSLETAALPAYLGSALRGALGRALYQKQEAYNYIYNNRVLSGNRQDIVNPYVLVPPAIGEASYPAGSELNFHLYLLGEAAQYAYAVIKALCEVRRLGLGVSRHPFELIKVVHSRVIWQGDCYHEAALRSVVVPCHSLPDVRKSTLRMLTPLRIRRDGTLLTTLDFSTIIRNVTQRLEALTKRYGGWVDTAEMQRILKLSAEVAVSENQLESAYLQRYSNRLGEKMDFSGLMGSIQFEGELTPFVPWLYAAQILHIGRNTTFGLGRVEVEFI